MKNAILLCAAALALAGCAQHPVAQVPALPAAEAPADFTLRGKIGFRIGERGGSAALVWQEDGGNYRLELSGPLGQGAARLTGDANRVTVEMRGETHRSNDPQALLAELVGWPVAIDALAFWVRGQPAPGDDALVQQDGAGRTVRIEQHGWQVRLDRYDGRSGYDLPYLLVADGGDSRITLSVNQWQFAPAP